MEVVKIVGSEGWGRILKKKITVDRQLLLSGRAQGFPGAVSSSNAVSLRVETSVRGTAGWCCQRWCISGDFMLEARPQNAEAWLREASLLEAPGGHEDICAAAAGPMASPPTARRKIHQEGLRQGPGAGFLCNKGLFISSPKLRWHRISAACLPAREGCMGCCCLCFPGPLTF